MMTLLIHSERSKLLAASSEHEALSCHYCIQGAMPLGGTERERQREEEEEVVAVVAVIAVVVVVLSVVFKPRV